jgi:hypothetical protein
MIMSTKVDQLTLKCIRVLKDGGMVKIHKYTGTPSYPIGKWMSEIRSCSLPSRGRGPEAPWPNGGPILAPYQVYHDAAARYFMFKNHNGIVAETDDKNRVLSLTNLAENESIVHSRLKTQLQNSMTSLVSFRDAYNRPIFV